MLRAREIVFDPAAVVTLHKHQSRPAVANIIEGEVTEYRVGKSGKYVVLVKKSGEAAFEGNNAVHRWKNETDRQASAVSYGYRS